MNFCNNYSQKLKISFPNKGFSSLVTIVQRHSTDIHVRAQMTLMVHITKMNMPLWLTVLLFMKIENLFVHSNLTRNLEEWKSVAWKTIYHPQVSEI